MGPASWASCTAHRDQPGASGWHNLLVPQRQDHPIVTIRYCVGCRWLLRAQWYQGELLQTFTDVLGGVLLVPSSGAMFRIEVGAVTVWNRKSDGGFPDITVLKRRVRDLVAPTMSLGHSEPSDHATDTAASADRE